MIVYRQTNTHSAKRLGVFNTYCTGDRSPAAYSDDKTRAVQAFEKESAHVFEFREKFDEKRMEQVRPLVIKVLLYVGFLPAKQSKSVVARLIELLAIEPSADVDGFIADMAKRTDTDIGAIKKTIARAFEQCDDDTIKKVKSLTDTDPFTSRDIIYDLALYVRKRYLGRGLYA